jgi:hypothetical protein
MSDIITTHMPSNSPEYYSRIEEALNKYPRIKWKRDSSAYEVKAHKKDGFDVVIFINSADQFNKESGTCDIYYSFTVLAVRVGSLSFSDLDLAINCFLNILSTNVRIEVSYRKNREYEKSFQIHYDNRWVSVKREKVRYPFWINLLDMLIFWKKKNKKYLQNDLIQGDDLTIEFLKE